MGTEEKVAHQLLAKEEELQHCLQRVQALEADAQAATEEGTRLQASMAYPSLVGCRWGPMGCGEGPSHRGGSFTAWHSTVHGAGAAAGGDAAPGPGCAGGCQCCPTSYVSQGRGWVVNRQGWHQAPSPACRNTGAGPPGSTLLEAWLSPCSYRQATPAATPTPPRACKLTLPIPGTQPSCTIRSAASTGTMSVALCRLRAVSFPVGRWGVHHFPFPPSCCTLSFLNPTPLQFITVQPSHSLSVLTAASTRAASSLTTCGAWWTQPGLGRVWGGLGVTVPPKGYPLPVQVAQANCKGVYWCHGENQIIKQPGPVPQPHASWELGWHPGAFQALRKERGHVPQPPLVSWFVPGGAQSGPCQSAPVSVVLPRGQGGYIQHYQQAKGPESDAATGEGTQRLQGHWELCIDSPSPSPAQPRWRRQC